ncbi:ATP-binding cassette sub-family G member 5 [Cephus cinctus]|uniref:ATP-binding cassette sub-family G member 5 n=1 Tax=Cephus cinctus TaxID=211228 RepID=A0AAJ7C446_CEPCN|nr:ATP-binding cassette sub-family G member 5 [Cephus cinctus]XP_015601503.1 ATP-binding cassette sub-family G member 5 [Cephus cinctus]XP_024944039.1 ATP-binding cassette sub-family G member 5 [Cephus cinctus]XP_024944042.1 ATP-binding cassette sub-family G member 5 [Cephus cinctus]XP_024944045.1 ATP-binding cassette sub-family G member 5 [Cephus cinctus]
MGSEAWELERRYSVPGALDTRGLEPPASEDLHAWSIYRQNLNSDFTDSALGSAEKSPLPYGNFQLRDSTVQSILRHPRYGPKSPLANNSYTYLKFGLPRVLPPSRVRDGSSGYDSSEEGRRISHATAHANIMRSARSDPDFRQVHAMPREQAHSQINVRDNPRFRSASEANLLNTARTNRRHSIAPTDPGYGHGVLGPEAYTVMTMRPVPAPQHPHLQLRGVEASGSDGLPLLRGISLEAGASEVLAVMSTTEREGTLIVETISGRRRAKRGDIILNGRSVSASALRSRVAYLPAESSLSPGLTAQQTLSFYLLLRGGAGTSSLEADAILQELGLEATKHCLVNTLTTSEARRLALACRLLQDSHILTLDRPTHGLDIFDAFFLVEYLRQWAGRGQRLVILTLHPPTYEILTMVSRVALTSGGRIMYSGPRRDMLPYFALAEFPCPPFKNPSDYYLDLVTLDDLSAEAMLESSQRIDHLAELARVRLPGLSDPGPPGALPPSISGANIFVQIYALLLRALIYSQPWALTRLLQKIVISASLSILLGAVFWDLAGDSNLYLRDRIGFHYASLAVLSWPLNLIAICNIATCRPNVERDMRDGLYGRFVYIFVELLCTIPSWCVVYLTYLAPAFAMSGLHLAPDENLTSLWNYLAVGLLYLMLQHLICVFFAHISKWPSLASLLAGIVIGEISLAGGVTLHLENLPFWYQKFSPMQWTLSLLLPQVHGQESMNKLTNCKAKQVQRQDIIVQAACEPSDGSLALREVAFDKLDVRSEFWLGICVATVVLLIIIGFLFVKYATPKRPRSAPNKP